MRIVILMLALTGCPKSDEAVAPSSRAPQIGAHLPQDATSKAYVGNLVDTTFTNFRPVEGGGAVLNYDTMRFRPDGTWAAEGGVSIMEDTMECTESGSWSMEPASSESVSVVTWSVEATDCASRSPGSDTRAQITLEDGGRYKFQFR